MDPVTILGVASGVEQLITLGIQVYQQIEASKTPSVKPLADILAAANANFQQIETTATQQANS